jgi:hypothetical protein
VIFNNSSGAVYVTTDLKLRFKRIILLFLSKIWM